MPSFASLADVLAPPLCVGCGRRAGRAEPLCPGCRAELRWLASEPVDQPGVGRLWAPLAYAGPARTMVAALKYRSARQLAPTMGAQILAGAPRELLARAVMVPVPLDASRRRRRGFNQAELIADAVAARTGVGVFDCLERRGPTATQVGRGRGERALAAAGAIGVRAGTSVPAEALLVDDVVTTGATLTACAVALRIAGAEVRGGLAYARTPGR